MPLAIKANNGLHPLGLLHREFPVTHNLEVILVSADDKTVTLLSDSDVAGNDSIEITSQPGCWLIAITVKGVNTLELIDTGVSITLMRRPLYQKVQQARALKLRMYDVPRLEGVGGKPVPTLGCAKVEVWDWCWSV